MNLDTPKGPRVPVIHLRNPDIVCQYIKIPPSPVTMNEDNSMIMLIKTNCLQENNETIYSSEHSLSINISVNVKVQSITSDYEWPYFTMVTLFNT